MLQTYNDKLLDFLAEGFLQQGSSVTYKEFFGIPAIEVSTENSVPRIYIQAQKEISKMSFLEQLPSEEIFVPVLSSEEEISLKAEISKAGITAIRVYRLSFYERNWDK